MGSGASGIEAKELELHRGILRGWANVLKQLIDINRRCLGLRRSNTILESLNHKQ